MSNGRRTHPESVPRGRDHWAAKMPDRVPRGDSWWAVRGISPEERARLAEKSLERRRWRGREWARKKKEALRNGSR